MAALHLPGGQPALEPQVEGPRSDRRKQREATKQRRAAAAQELQQLRAWKQARADTGGSGEGSPGKATGKGNNNKKGKSNLHSKTRDGKEVCYSWNNKQGKCADVSLGQAVSVGQGACLPEVPQRQAPFGGVPAVGLGSAVPPAGVQGDGAASHPCPNAEEDSIVVESHARGSPPVREERPFPPKVCLSPAAEEAAEGATSWEEFRGRRLFRFVHWFAGTARFGVGEAVVAEASKHGLRAEHISLDRDRDGVDLAADEPAESHLAWAREHKVDGAHAGFPCSTFSRLRFREQPGMPGPVRDLEHMRGLPSNTPAQQKEADVGWLLAARSATFMDAVRSSARERSVQAVATLENPLPSGPPYPSAFFVDEVAAFLQDEESEAAEFNSCICGMPNWKPARWAGALRGLASLSGRCKCKVPHEQIIGKKASAAAARYPPALCEVYAELVVKAWEETLSKEWEIISQRRRPAEGGEQAQPLVRVGRFGNVLVRQQLAELSWKGSRAGRFGLSGAAVQEGPEGGGERQVHREHAWASQGGQVDPRPAARRLGGGSRVPVLCQVAPRSAGGGGQLRPEGLRGPVAGVGREVEASPSRLGGRQGQSGASGLRAMAVPLGRHLGEMAASRPWATPRCPSGRGRAIEGAHRRARHLSEDRGGERRPSSAGRAGGVHVRLQKLFVLLR